MFREALTEFPRPLTQERGQLVTALSGGGVYFITSVLCSFEPSAFMSYLASQVLTVWLHQCLPDYSPESSVTMKDGAREVPCVDSGVTYVTVYI